MFSNYACLYTWIFTRFFWQCTEQPSSQSMHVWITEYSHVFPNSVYSTIIPLLMYVRITEYSHVFLDSVYCTIISLLIYVRITEYSHVFPDSVYCTIISPLMYVYVPEYSHVFLTVCTAQSSLYRFLSSFVLPVIPHTCS